MQIEKPAIRIEMKRITVFDVVLIGTVLLLSTGILFRERLSLASPKVVSAKGVVYHDGQMLLRIDLSKNGTTTLPGSNMVLVVSGGKIRVQRSDCHRQMCVHAGWIGYSGEIIACVPNKTIIEVAAGSVPVVDAVVF